MAVQIPFPIPNHGYALNSKMRVNLDFLVDKFNEFNTGSATWDTVGIGIANNETGTLTFYNASNANFLTIEAGATAANTTYTLPLNYPLVGNGQFLKATTTGVMSWGILRDFASAITGNQLLYTDGVGVLQEVPVGVGNKVLVNSTPPSFFSLLGTSNQIVVTPSVGAFTLSTPQDIDTSSNVIFNSVQSDGGTAVNPGIRVIFSGAATNTGIFSSSGTSLSFSVAGVSQFSLDNAGGGAFVSSVRAPAIRATTSIALSTGGSGHILTMQMPTSGGADYTITWPNAVGGLNTVLTTDASGNLSWTSVSGAGAATTALDNLASVAINTSLLPASDNTIDLGSASKEFRSAYLKTSLIFQESGAGTDTITIQAPSSIAAGYTLTLPVDDGTTDQVLKTDGSGVLSWVTAGTLSGTVNSGTANQLAFYATSSTAVSGASPITWDQSKKFSLTLSSASLEPEFNVINNQSSGSGAGAHISVTVLSTGGDPYYLLQDGTQDWSIGVDNSVDSSLRFSTGIPGSTDRVIFGTTGAVTFTGALAMGTNKITGLSNGTTSTDAAAFGQIPVFTDWASYTPTVVGLGTLAFNSAYWRQEGNQIHVRFFFTAGTVSGSTFSISLPNSTTISTTKLPGANTLVGTAVSCNSSGSSTNLPVGAIIFLFSDDVTTTTIFGSNQSNTSQFVKNAGNVITSSGYGLTGEFTYPI